MKNKTNWSITLPATWFFQEAEDSEDPITIYKENGVGVFWLAVFDLEKQMNESELLDLIRENHGTPNTPNASCFSGANGFVVDDSELTSTSLTWYLTSPNYLITGYYRSDSIVPEIEKSEALNVLEGFSEQSA